jgi:hypothetical protein
MRGSGFSTPTTEESRMKCRCAASPVSSRIERTEPFEFEITPATSPAARTRRTASIASGSARFHSPTGRL